MIELTKIGPALWEIAPAGKMLVPARIYATDAMLEQVKADNAPQQVVNVAHLPGIVKAAMAMPDIHWGYGFPIGGVAAFRVSDGIISPGGVGYDINCGVRLMATELTRKDVQHKLSELISELFRAIPTGVGSSGALKVKQDELQKVAMLGAKWAVEHGYGSAEDLEYIEDGGCIDGADITKVSSKAWQRGLEQLGTLGSGNHFLEIGFVEEVFDKACAEAFGLFPDQVTIIIHCGSRGFGYQICDDYLAVMDKATKKYKIEIPDRQLACAPIDSDEGRAYFGAMNCAINYAFANRQVISHLAADVFRKVFRTSGKQIGLRTVYEVAHNIAKYETHKVGNTELKLCVHRKGATRALASGSASLPRRYLNVGQPVLIPGDMGRCSYVLTGTARALDETFSSCCHGAGRAMSRNKAKSVARGRDITKELASRGIIVRGQSRATMEEELPEAYKDVSTVVDACELAGIAKKVVRLRPLGCIKG